MGGVSASASDCFAFSERPVRLGLGSLSLLGGCAGVSEAAGAGLEEGPAAAASACLLPSDKPTVSDFASLCLLDGAADCWAADGAALAGGLPPGFGAAAESEDSLLLDNPLWLGFASACARPLAGGGEV